MKTTNKAVAYIIHDPDNQLVQSQILRLLKHVPDRMIILGVVPK